ncbi:MAG: hypothetical protein ACE5O2_03930 [Armatimonadota bacterium]
MLICVASLAFASARAAGIPAQRLEVCPRHPYYFRDGGRHILLLGISDRSLFAIWRNPKGADWRAYLDALADCDANYVRHNVLEWDDVLVASRYPAQWTNLTWPFLRLGPGDAIDDKPRFDLTALDDSYFRDRVRPFIRHAAARGIYVELTLFDDVGARRFQRSLYTDRNNVNELGLSPHEATSDAALRKPNVIAMQERYVDAVLRATHDFGNVIYEIANETGGARWVEHFVDYIHHHPQHPGRLVSAGEQNSDYDPRRGRCDIVVKHRGGKFVAYATDDDVLRHHDLLMKFRAGKPVTHNEFFLYANRSTQDPDFVRKMMWGDFTAGGHANFYDFSFWRGTGRTLDEGEPSRPWPTAITNGVAYLKKFLEDTGLPFWEMQPRPGITQSNGSIVLPLVAETSHFLYYVLGSAPTRVRVSLPPGRFRARWYDPKVGEWIAEQAIEGSQAVSLQAPEFRDDAVLYVSAIPAD